MKQLFINVALGADLKEVELINNKKCLKLGKWVEKMKLLNSV